MTLTDLAAFQADYHNPALRAADVAQRYGVAEGSLAEFARGHGLKSRQELGIRSRSKQPSERIGSRGCRPSCPGWAECQRHMGREAPLCEVMSYLDENPALLDTEPSYGGGVVLGVRLYFLEDEI